MPERGLQDRRGCGSLGEERVAAPIGPSWATDGDARPAHYCIDCGSPTERDESLPRPFDVTCAACLAMRAELARRIKEAIDDLADAEEGLTDWYTRPVRPAWRVGGTNVWKRKGWRPYEVRS